MRNQTLITVRDVRRSADWYQSHLGLSSGHGGDEYEQLIADNRLILQLHNMEPDENHEALLESGETPGRGVLLWFAVDDFDAVVKRLERLQASLDKAPFFNPYARQWEVWLRDPDGYRIVLSGPSGYRIQALQE